MKTIFNFSVLVLLLVSCRTVQKATEDQLTEYKRAVTATQQTAQKQLQETSQVKFTNLTAVSSSDNGIERLIEEQVVEYSIPRRDSLQPAAETGRVTRTSRKIRERGSRKDLSVQQSAIHDSLQQQQNSQTDVDSRVDETAQRQDLQRRRTVRRTGVPWYVWAGSAVTVTLSFWFGKKIRDHRAAIRPWQNFEP